MTQQEGTNKEERKDDGDGSKKHTFFFFFFFLFEKEKGGNTRLVLALCIVEVSDRVFVFNKTTHVKAKVLLVGGVLVFDLVDCDGLSLAHEFDLILSRSRLHSL